MRRTRPRRRSTRSGADRGAGLVSTLAGTLVFIVLLLFAAQVLLNLYAASVVTAAAFDAARVVAGSDAGLAAAGDAQTQADGVLGRYAEHVSWDWSGSDDEMIDVHVVAENPNKLLPGLAGRLAFDRLDRHVRVRVERFRA
jgi:Flp pilus assembly protein TadG